MTVCCVFLSGGGTQQVLQSRFPPNFAQWQIPVVSRALSHGELLSGSEVCYVRLSCLLTMCSWGYDERDGDWGGRVHVHYKQPLQWSSWRRWSVLSTRCDQQVHPVCRQQWANQLLRAGLCSRTLLGPDAAAVCLEPAFITTTTHSLTHSPTDSSCNISPPAARPDRLTAVDVTVVLS